MNGISLEKARLYGKYRLPYASEAVEDLCKSVTAHEVVADIGAGTGQLTRVLVDKSKKVYVVEPDPAMREIASLFLVNLAEVEIRAASAEQTTLTENSIDLIVIGNAFHRFKPQALDELRRILRRQGWIALFSYGFTNEAFTEMLFTKLATLLLITHEGCRPKRFSPDAGASPRTATALVKGKGACPPRRRR